MLFLALLVAFSYSARGASVADVNGAIERRGESLRLEAVEAVKLEGFGYLGRQDLTAMERSCICNLINLAPSQVNEVLVPAQLALMETVAPLMLDLQPLTVLEVGEIVEDRLLDEVRPVVKDLKKKMKKCT